MGSRRPKLRAWEQEPADGWQPDRDDLVAVEHPTADTMIVRHYPNPETKRPCCKLQVQISDKDREQRREYEQYPGATAALERAHTALASKHARRATIRQEVKPHDGMAR